MLSNITYFRRFEPYVRRFWPSDVVPFTVVIELNSIYHLHCMRFIINFVLLLLWFGIYLQLVTANKILTNFKSNAQL
jgi:hypothetical protein